MKRNSGFDEVMIVNPCDPAAMGDAQGETSMQFHYAESPEFAEYEPVGEWGEQEFAEFEPVGGYAAPAPYGYYTQPPGMAGWGAAGPYGSYAKPEFAKYEPVAGYSEADPYGQFAETDPYGYYAEPPDMGACGEVDPYGSYAEPEFAEYEPVGYYAEEYPVAGYGYAQSPELVGWGQADPYGYYAEPEFAGYVRDTPPTFNPSCPMPTNVAGFGEYPFEGYVKPRNVSPTCEQFSPPPDGTTAVPDTFRPIW
ncbi:MAG: hypothetical protein LAN84_08485 [Acidobacteriia bacterium]|nr:hypothetical protein [Terriglobia bacterium]